MSPPNYAHRPTRLDSFQAITKPKSRAKPGWPLSPSTHPHLTPENLASAGFYHTPGSSTDTHDSVTCFLCKLQLGGWDEEDDPFEEHARRGKCAWAETVCQVRVDKVRNGAEGGRLRTTYPTPESLPQSTESSALREQTFGKWWPHKAKAGWLPTVKNLARAGFIYTPTDDARDCVTCVLCDYAVLGWEATDDPWETHLKKAPECRFFIARVEGEHDADEKSKASSRSTKSQATKRSKRATTAQASQREEEPQAQAAETVADETESVAASQSQSSRRTRKPRATTAESSKPKATRGRKKAAEDVAESQAEEAETASAAEEAESAAEAAADEVAPKKGKGTGKATAKPRATRGRKPKATPAPDEAESEVVEGDEAHPVETVEPSEMDEPTPKSKPSQPSKSSKPSSSQSNTQSQPLSKSTRSKPPARPADKPLPSLPLPPPTSTPQPLSLLETFANIPPSSPAVTPRPPKHVTSKSRHADMARDVLERSVEEGAREARGVMDGLVGGQAQGEEEEEMGMRAPLTEAQKSMTVEEMVRLEMRKRAERLRQEGEEMIGRWEGRARDTRRRIEAV